MDKNEDLILGIDVGGTGLKAAVYTLDGHMLGDGYSEYGLISERPGQAEQDANQWWQSTIGAVRQASERVDPVRIRSVGISCTNGIVPVDQRAEPVNPAIMLWDQRAIKEVDYLQSVLGEGEIERVSGNPAAPGAYYLPSIQWLKANHPKLFEKTYKFLVPGGFLVAKLTGNFTIDYSRACTSQLFDIRKSEWHEPFFEKLEIPMDKLPKLMPSTRIAGYVTEMAAQTIGLKAGTPVAAGVSDTISADIGANCMQPGQTLIIMGTAARVTMIMEKPIFDTRFMNFVSPKPGQWVSLGAINGVGSVLRWVRDILAVDERRESSQRGADVYDLITEQAKRSPPGAKGLLLLPYLAGERTPIWDPKARGILFGLSISHCMADLFRAFLEGPAFGIRQAVEIIANKEHPGLESITIGGTAAKSEVWRQIICDVVGKPMNVLQATHVEVLGAAVVGAVAAGLYPDLENAMQCVAQPVMKIEVNPNLHTVYNDVFQLYKKLYPQNRPLFAELAALTLPGGWI